MYYHRVATSQAEKSFTYGVIAAVLGLFVVLMAAVLAAVGGSAAASISAAAVGLGGGGLAAYVGGTFMRLQETSASQLRAYFAQPLEFSRLLAAERLLDQLDDEHRSPATREVIQALVSSGASSNERDT